MARKNTNVSKWCDNNPRKAAFAGWYLIAALFTFTVMIAVYAFKIVRGVIRLITSKCDQIDKPVVVVEETTYEESQSTPT